MSLDPIRSCLVPLLQWRPTVSNLVALMTCNSSPKHLFLAGCDTQHRHRRIYVKKAADFFFFSTDVFFFLYPSGNLSNHLRSRIRPMSRHSTYSWKVGHVSTDDLKIQAYCKCLLVKWSWHASKF